MALKDADAFYKRLSSRMERRYMADASETQKECERPKARHQEIDSMSLEQEANQKRLQGLALTMRRTDKRERDTFIREIRRYAAILEPDKAALNRLIRKLLAGDVKKPDGQKGQEARIVYNFFGEIPKIME